MSTTVGPVPWSTSADEWTPSPLESRYMYCAWEELGSRSRVARTRVGRPNAGVFIGAPFFGTLAVSAVAPWEAGAGESGECTSSGEAGARSSAAHPRRRRPRVLPPCTAPDPAALEVGKFPS